MELNVNVCLVLAVVASIITVLVVGAFGAFLLNRMINKFFKNVRDTSEDCIKTIEEFVDKFDEKIKVVHEEEEVEGVIKTRITMSFNDDTIMKSNFETKI